MGDVGYHGVPESQLMLRAEVDITPPALRDPLQNWRAIQGKDRSLFVRQPGDTSLLSS